MSRSKVSPFIVPPGDGHVIRGPAGGPATVKANTETTNGSFTLLEVGIGPKEGPPLHSHRREDEMWYILESNFRFIADDQIFMAEPGSFFFVPRQTAHCFQNLGDSPGKLLVMFTPSGMERFFEEHAALPAGPADPDRYREIANNSWMDVLGPPLGQLHPLD